MKSVTKYHSLCIKMLSSSLLSLSPILIVIQFVTWIIFNDNQERERIGRGRRRKEKKLFCFIPNPKDKNFVPDLESFCHTFEITPLPPSSPFSLPLYVVIIKLYDISSATTPLLRLIQLIGESVQTMEGFLITKGNKSEHAFLFKIHQETLIDCTCLSTRWLSTFKCNGNWNETEWNENENKMKIKWKRRKNLITIITC